ncbi:helix-turn-helix domain-containing protein [Pseudoduganella sp. DS3]|uniref:Helix-turn-helix domain-containing protein n=1 Tax=Pseudoduganella guangdongensis TaxID=2692179 RepID=A0A6N9HFF8_9BURK|nr:helix-turn-helix transcriptional regulator [Pseudoduganella guangdongensis]MYN01555.1 helix-turn-helix domain-containing protein [Pseudoduganella guangdongensis]
MDFTIQTLDHLKPLIQGFRKKANLTQAAMAEKLGISQQSYAQIESNLASTSVDRLFTILRLMNVKLQVSDSDPDTLPVFQVKSKSSTRRRSIEAKAKVEGRGSQAGKVLPTNTKPGMAAAPAKVVKAGDTTEW